MAHVRFGVDRLVHEPSLLRGAQRVGLVTNDAARLAENATVRSRSVLIAAGVPLVRLFGPEHGLTADAADGAAVADGRDQATGLEVCSLYGDRMRPTREQIGDLDVVLFDIPDVGARFYTYAWTLLHVLSACAEYGVRLVVLDRPNPLGGRLSDAEGPLLDPGLFSFIGADTFPIRHSLTLGELALLWRAERFPQASVEVLTCSGWRRGDQWPQTMLPWVPTSPAMPAFLSALCYPGTCFFEATNLSVGRGTDAPFQRIGAPWLGGERVRTALRDVLGDGALPGVQLEPELFVPTNGPYAGERCSGLRLAVADTRTFRPVATGLALLAAVAGTHRGVFGWWRYPTAANPSGDGHLDRLVGLRRMRERVERSATMPIAELQELTAVPGWSDRVRGVLLYPE